MTKWILPCKLENYDVLGKFATDGFIDWGVSNNVQIGDVVYIYVGAPVQKILLKALVKKETPNERLETDGYEEKNYDEIQPKDKFMTLKVEECFIGKKMKYLTMNELRKHGVKGNFQGPRNLNNNIELLEYIEMIEA